MGIGLVGVLVGVFGILGIENICGGTCAKLSHFYLIELLNQLVNKCLQVVEKKGKNNNIPLRIAPPYSTALFLIFFAKKDKSKKILL